MKKLIVLAAFFMMGCIQVRCVKPLGQLVYAPADGRFDKQEIERLRKIKKSKQKIKSSGVTYQALKAYANDMDVFIRRFIFPKWKGVTGLYMNVVENRTDLLKAWDHCTRWTKQKPGKTLVGFHCPYNGEITILGKLLKQTIEIYDHEEGHYQNDLDGDAAEFSSEYNARWKAFIRFAMDYEIGSWFSDYINSTPPRDNKARSIKKIGNYRAASLMFFFVANHYKGDLSKGAKFIFTSSEKPLLKFFYTKLNAYPKNKTVREIWQIEVLKLWDGMGIQYYMRNLRRKAEAYRKAHK